MKKKIGLIFALLLLLVAVPVGATTKKGFYADNSVTLNDELDTTAFVAGNMVNVSSKIDGLAFIAGNTVNIKSEQDYLFTAGNMITLNGVKAKDVFVAGSSITIDESTIRDLYAAGESVIINSNIDRNAYLGGTTVTINGTISGDVEVGCEELVVAEGAKVLGRLHYPEEAKLIIEEGAEIGSKESYKGSVDINVKEKAAGAALIAFFVSLVLTLLTKIVTGCVLLFLFKKVFDKIRDEEKNANNFFAKLGIGFGVLCLVPIVALMLILTRLLTPIGIIGAIIYGILIYLSIIPTAYYVGNWIFKDSIKNEYLLYIASVAILYVVTRIPVIGGICGFVSLCVGLGIFATLIYQSMSFGKEEKKTKK